MKRIKMWARQLKNQLFVLYYAYQDPRVPWSVKIFVISVVAYAFSPIDLIPDFIPVLGYLDDVLLVPLGIYFSLKMLSPEVKLDAEAKAAARPQTGKPKNWVVAFLIVLLWIALLTWIGYQLNEHYGWI